MIFWIESFSGDKSFCTNVSFLVFTSRPIVLVHSGHQFKLFLGRFPKNQQWAQTLNAVIYNRQNERKKNHGKGPSKPGTLWNQQADADFFSVWEEPWAQGSNIRMQQHPGCETDFFSQQKLHHIGHIFTRTVFQKEQRHCETTQGQTHKSKVETLFLQIGLCGQGECVITIPNCSPIISAMLKLNVTQNWNDLQKRKTFQLSQACLSVARCPISFGASVLSELKTHQEHNQPLATVHWTSKLRPFLGYSDNQACIVKYKKWTQQSQQVNPGFWCHQARSAGWRWRPMTFHKFGTWPVKTSNPEVGTALIYAPRCLCVCVCACMCVCELLTTLN